MVRKHPESAFKCPKTELLGPFRWLFVAMFLGSHNGISRTLWLARRCMFGLYSPEAAKYTLNTLSAENSLAFIQWGAASLISEAAWRPLDFLISEVMLPGNATFSRTKHQKLVSRLAAKAASLIKEAAPHQMKASEFSALRVTRS